MALSYLGYAISYEMLYDRLGTRPYGTPFRHLQRLADLGLTVVMDYLSIAEIETYIAQDLPVIAGVHTAALPYWTVAADHVVVLVGVEPDHVYLHDPVMKDGPQRVSRTAFELAQLDFDNLCAVITKKWG